MNTNWQMGALKNDIDANHAKIAFQVNALHSWHVTLNPGSEAQSPFEVFTLPPAAREKLGQVLQALESCTPEDATTGHYIPPRYDVDAVESAIETLRAMGVTA